MAITSRRAPGRRRRPISVAKPSGSIHPRVQKVGPEHFGIVPVDCAKARSKWMLTDFYGNILIPPTTVDHTRPGVNDFVARIRQAMTDHQLHDLLVALERTGNYHRPLQRTATAAGFEARIVHPLTSKQYRLPADPGNKTDDTDLAAIQRATVNGFGLIDPVLDQTHAQLRLLARHRRDLVRKNADLRNQIHVELDALFPGLSAAVGGIFDHEPALVIARHLGSAQEILARGLDGLDALLRAAHLRPQRRSLEKILAWADQAHEASECTDAHKRIFTHLDDERRTRLAAIRALERDLASPLVRTPYLLLLSFPGINVVSAAEFAGEMGPIANSPSDTAISGRGGTLPLAVPERPRGSHRAAGPSRQPRLAVRVAADRREPAQVQRSLPQPERGLAGGRGEPARLRGARRQAVLPDRLPDGGRPPGVPPPELPGAALHSLEVVHFLW